MGLSLSSKLWITQFSGQQGPSCRFCTFLGARHSCNDGSQATIMTTSVKVESENDMQGKCDDGLPSSSTFRV